MSHVVNPRFARRRDRLRRNLGGMVISNTFKAAAKVARLHPQANPAKHGVEVKKNIAYVDDGNSVHSLDVYRPVDLGKKLRPTVLFIHGGGFRILSKDTHWVFALALARRGYVVFSINYRLAPEHPFPAAVEDVADAYAFTVRAARTFGGDPNQLIVTGESAGGNLSLGTAISACYQRDEPWCKTIWDTGVVPKVVAPLCGILQVSNVERLLVKGVCKVVGDRVHEISDAYLGGAEGIEDSWKDLADPLLVLESEAQSQRPLPPMFTSCGTNDLLLEDSLRLNRALEKREVRTVSRVYQGELHAFQAFVWRKNAQQSWRDLFEFLDEEVPPPSSSD
ncbi:MAG: alpha/beta hydrolase [Deltaproteobacteria bacterium]|nr:alpha/beta hydrolase [Deltaproteobacteria bacterium]